MTFAAERLLYFRLSEFLFGTYNHWERLKLIKILKGMVDNQHSVNGAVVDVTCSEVHFHLYGT
jgi:hypothetical protein